TEPSDRRARLLERGTSAAATAHERQRAHRTQQIGPYRRARSDRRDSGARRAATAAGALAVVTAAPQRAQNRFDGPSSKSHVGHATHSPTGAVYGARAA